MQRRSALSRTSARHRGYGAAWDRARAGFLRLHPHCAECAREGLTVRATVVDHIVPHRGDQRLFWDASNWQPLCTNHHSSDKQQREKRGYSARVLASGLPGDANHPFYAAQGEQPSDGDRRQRPPQRPRRPSAQTEGASKVDDLRGRGPLGDHRAELVSRTGSEDSSVGAAARPSTSSDRASARSHLTPSIAASPPLIRGRRRG
ncbi:HNH endonuclease [Bosea sp. (in: a-proteobacteria)]|uniref:HNH endonuclease n=1 Tax=Bosea sp. (in: a-proteobacteria) TaxID=1871050 RepID=UPI003B3A4CDB